MQKQNFHKIFYCLLDSKQQLDKFLLSHLCSTISSYVGKWVSSEQMLCWRGQQLSGPVFSQNFLYQSYLQTLKIDRGKKNPYKV
jgi:hypothetical protein